MSKEIAYNLERPPYCAGCGAPMPWCSCDEAPADEGTLRERLTKAIYERIRGEGGTSWWDAAQAASEDALEVLATELQKARAEGVYAALSKFSPYLSPAPTPDEINGLINGSAQ